MNLHLHLHLHLYMHLHLHLHLPLHQVLLDENLIRVSCESPLYLGAADKEALNEALQRDTAFLASHEMMDYSLLAGICPQGDQLVVGIIDYIR